MESTEQPEPSAKQIAYEDLAYTAQCALNSSYNVDEDDAMLGFDAVGPCDN